MSYFLNQDEPIEEFNKKNIKDEILSNIFSQPEYNMFFILENHGIPDIDFMIVRNKYVNVHTAKGFLGYESIDPKMVQEILLVSIQPLKDKKLIEINFPHQKILYPYSSTDFKNKFIRYLMEESNG